MRFVETPCGVTPHGRGCCCIFIQFNNEHHRAGCRVSEGWKNGYWELFKCPLCGSAKYVEVRVQRPSGLWYTTPFYQCFTCSVMFRDPVLFTRCKVDTANDELRPHHLFAVKPQRSQ